MKIRIKTSLIGKEEEFRKLELARVLRKPILLIGAPGVGKTMIVQEYFHAISGEKNRDALFIIETDESTPISAIKGSVNLEKLFTENKFTRVTPIAKAKCILINEIDKASSHLRDSLLGIMNERMILLGEAFIPTDWEVFVATCNSIPRSEQQSALFDRFIIKHEVSPISSAEMMRYYHEGGRQNYSTYVEINLADRDSMDRIIIPTEKLRIFVELFIDVVSNRTLSYMPDLVKAISCIWDLDSIDRALIKCAEIMLSREAALKLMHKLYSELQITLYSKLDMLQLVKNTEEREKSLNEIGRLLKKYKASKGACGHFIQEIESAMMSYGSADQHFLLSSQANLN